MPTVATVNYDQIYNFSVGTTFKYFDIYRPIDKGHICKLKKSILNQKNQGFYPIMVDISDLRILDGHHRYEAIQQLWEEGYTDIPMRVRFVNPTANGIDRKELVMKINKVFRKWTMEDYIYSYIKGGNENYKSLINFCKECTLTRTTTPKNGIKYNPRYASAMLKGMHCQSDILKGTFTVSDEEYKEGLKISKELEQFVNKLDFKPNQNLEPLIIAWFEFRNNGLQIPFEELLKGVNKSSCKSAMTYNSKDYWFNLFCGVQTKMNRK